ncbi:MAG: T9SS type A sorting domain-containing protein, partial [Pedobacter sp.]
AFFSNYAIEQPGTLDDLVSPAIDFGTKDSSILTFRVAHADYDINDLASWDGLEVLVSGDGGATFQLAYKKTGDKLRTIATSQSGTFSATPAQTGRWRSDSVNLTTYIQPGKRLFVVFRNVNAFGNNTIIDDISITAAQKVVVPLRLISFTGSKQNGFNQLNWKTANEVNTKEFSLEYSTDATNFSALATINSDRSALEANYHYNHLNPAKQNFYRLKMIDIDGRFTYSNTVKLSGEGNLLVYPTPAKELISVSGLDKKGDIRLLSADGKIMLTQTVTSNVQTINIGQLAKGVYVLQYINGNSVQTQKIIKE